MPEHHSLFSRLRHYKSPIPAWTIAVAAGCAIILMQEKPDPFKEMEHRTLARQKSADGLAANEAQRLTEEAYLSGLKGMQRNVDTVLQLAEKGPISFELCGTFAALQGGEQNTRRLIGAAVTAQFNMGSLSVTERDARLAETDRQVNKVAVGFQQIAARCQM